MTKGIILLVEDLSDDVYLTQRVFFQCKICNPIRVVSSGEDALSYMLGVGRYADREAYPLPVLILLDLKLRGMTGLEFLEALRLQTSPSVCPVIVLSVITDLKRIEDSYKLGVASFLIKPLSAQDVMSMVTYLPRILISETENAGYELACV